MGWTDCGAVAGEFQQGEVMLVILPISLKDCESMLRLVAWMAKLGGCKGHQALIVTHTNISFDQVIELRAQALQVFDAVQLIASEQRDTGWPGGSNALFWTAARHCAEPFLWLEADCVPMRVGWLSAIHEAWSCAAMNPAYLFMGHIYGCTQPFLPSRLMSGIAVYSPEGISLLPFLKDSPRAWDVDGAEVMVANGTHTDLIYHFYGEQNLPPTFVARKDAQSPVNAMTLEDIPMEACLFHRCKGPSLIKLLERKLFPEEFARQELVVCWPVFQGDIGQAIHHANWLRKLNRRWENEAIICHDPSCSVTSLNQFEQLLRQSFARVNSFVYPRPGIPTYPAAANWMFQSIALHMAQQKNPWLLMEADAVVLKADWLEQLQNEYNRAGMPWMGPHVKGMRHANGSMIYPADAALRMPKAMSCSDQAWDYHGWEDYMPECHDGSSLLQHIWSIVGEDACEVGGGQIPTDVTPERARRWIRPTSVVVHRIKGTSLTNLLMSGQYRP